MTYEWNILISICCIIFSLLMLKRNKKADDNHYEKICTTAESPAPKAPPPTGGRPLPKVPPRLPLHPDLQILNYPKCPIDRMRNQPGKPQVIFWDQRSSCYICCHGHRFTGRE